jgi:hypothetical protein
VPAATLEIWESGCGLNSRDGQMFLGICRLTGYALEGDGSFEDLVI